MDRSAHVTTEPSTQAIDAVVEALWPARGAASRVLIGPGVEASSYEGPGEPTRERDLAKAIRDGAATVVIVRKLSPALLRALRTTPPPLVVLTGDGLELEDRSEVHALGRYVLGPGAVLRTGDLATRTPARAIACAHNGEELEGEWRDARTTRIDAGVASRR